MAESKQRKKRKNSKQFNKRFKKRFFTRSTLVVIFFVFVIVGMIGIGYRKLEGEAQRRESQVENLRQEIEALKEENRALEEDKDNMDSPEFKEKIAREDLHFVKDGEYVIQEGQQKEDEATTEQKDPDE